MSISRVVRVNYGYDNGSIEIITGTLIAASRAGKEKDVRAKAALAGQPRCTFTDERRDLARYPDLG